MPDRRLHHDETKLCVKKNKNNKTKPKIPPCPGKIRLHSGEGSSTDSTTTTEEEDDDLYDSIFVEINDAAVQFRRCNREPLQNVICRFYFTSSRYANFLTLSLFFFFLSCFFISLVSRILAKT